MNQSRLTDSAEIIDNSVTSFQLVLELLNLILKRDDFFVKLKLLMMMLRVEGLKSSFVLALQLRLRAFVFCVERLLQFGNDFFEDIGDETRCPGGNQWLQPSGDVF